MAKTTRPRSSIQPAVEGFAKEAAAAQQRIRDYVDKWSWLVTNYGWKFDVTYCMTAEDMPDGHRNVQACAIWQFEYLRANLYFNLRSVKDLDNADLEELVVHEITHLLLGAYDPEDATGKEYVTTTVARCFVGLNNANQAKPTKKGV